jgi:hypothetical protein
VRFADRVDIDERDAQAVRDGEVLVWLVQAECQPPSYQRMKADSEERCRFNGQKVLRATPLAGSLAESAIAYLDHPNQDQGWLAFSSPYYDGEIHDPTAELPPGTCPICLGNLTESGTCETGHKPIANSEDDDQGTTVVGSIYGPEHRGDTQRLLDEAFGKP